MTHAALFASVPLLRSIVLSGVVFAAALGAAAAATPPDSTSAEPCPVTAARVVLWHSGKVTLNSVAVPIEKLGSAFAALTPRPTEVCYSQENSDDQSRDLGSFFEVLIFVRMPISMYTDTSFLHRGAVIPARTPNNRWRGP
jgi:hypothetical protein